MNSFHLRSLYFTNRVYGYKVTCDQNKNLLNQLSSNQEEADTKVFLATQFAENVGCSDTTIFTVDSDITILATFYVRQINCRLMVHIGVGSNMRILVMGTSKSSDGVLETLPALHAISGCYWKWKNKVVEYCSKERRVFAKCMPTGRYYKNQC